MKPTSNFAQNILHNIFLTDRQDIFNGVDPIQVIILSALGFLMYLFGEYVIISFHSKALLLISNLTNELRLHQFLGTCLPQ